MQTTFTPEALTGFATAVYRSLEVPDDQARAVAEALVQADLFGHQSHGVMRTFWYAARYQSGAMARVTEPELVVDAGAVAVIDGHDGAGQVLAMRAMDEAIARARAHGIGAVAVRNSGHIGTCMRYTRRAALDGCVGYLATNASPAMAPWQGREPKLGNNPWSWAAPAGRYPPMLMDLCNAAVARGKIYLAEKRAEPIPLGWAMDRQGRPTTDARVGRTGITLPMAGHKGYAISVAMDMLSGVLAGSAVSREVTGVMHAKGRSGVGHLVLALDIAAFRPMAEFEADMAAMIDGLKTSAPAEGETEVLYPGEPEARAEARQRRDGIRLPEDTVAELNVEAGKRGLDGLG